MRRHRQAWFVVGIIAHSIQSRRYSSHARGNHGHGESAGVGQAKKQVPVPRTVNLSATLRVIAPKPTILSVLAFSAAQQAEMLGYDCTSALLTRRREPRNPRCLLRSATAREWLRE